MIGYCDRCVFADVTIYLKQSVPCEKCHAYRHTYEWIEQSVTPIWERFSNITYIGDKIDSARGLSKCWQLIEWFDN